MVDKIKNQHSVERVDHEKSSDKGSLNIYESRDEDSVTAREADERMTGNALPTLPEGEVVDYTGAQSKQSKEEVALVRKLDFRLVPVLWSMYFLNYLDRNAIAQARLNHLERDLNLKGVEYNVCISILFVGYTLAQIPSNLAMASKSIRPSLWMACWMMAWAVVSASTAGVKDYAGMVSVRFILGIVEAPFYPGALYLMSLFYTRKELATRIALLYSGNIIATACSGLIAAATFASIDGAHGLAGWQWLFIIEGIVTFSVAAAAIFLLPDHPLKTKWLTPEERELAHSRIERDTVALGKSKGPIEGFKQAVRDPRLYLMVIMQNLHLSACGFNSFFPTVVGSLGYSSTITLVLSCPPYLFSAIAGILVSVSSGRRNERTWHITICCFVGLIGFIISCVTLNRGARYVSCFLFAAGAYASNSIILGWVSATLGQTGEKKAASLSIVNTIANASFAYTPFLYPKSDGPRYLIAMSANSAFVVCTAICAWILRLWLSRQNAAMRRSNAQTRTFYAY